jgi:hypothetical protein
MALVGYKCCYHWAANKKLPISKGVKSKIGIKERKKGMRDEDTNEAIPV